MNFHLPNGLFSGSAQASWGRTIIPELLQRGSDFSAQVSLHSWASGLFVFFCFFISFQDSLPGVSRYVSLTYDVVVLENTHLISWTLLF